MERRIVVITRDGLVEQAYLLEQDWKSDNALKADLDAISSAARSRGCEAEVRTLMHSRAMTADMIMERVGADIDAIVDAEGE